LKKSITCVILDQYHSLKCEEQFFSSNIINVVYIGLTSDRSFPYPNCSCTNILMEFRETVTVLYT